eukprot:1147374-Pelagomonas_calceolata.AAC.14
MQSGASRGHARPPHFLAQHLLGRMVQRTDHMTVCRRLWERGYSLDKPKNKLGVHFTQLSLRICAQCLITEPPPIVNEADHLMRKHVFIGPSFAAMNNLQCAGSPRASPPQSAFVATVRSAKWLLRILHKSVKSEKWRLKGMWEVTIRCAAKAAE